MTAGFGSIWVAGGPSSTVTRIDRATGKATSNTVTRTVSTGGETDALALGAGALWYGTTTSNMLGRIDPATNAILGKLKLPGPSFGAVVAYGFVWVTDAQDNRLFQIRPT